jgi:hypothetical protein
MSRPWRRGRSNNMASSRSEPNYCIDSNVDGNGAIYDRDGRVMWRSRLGRCPSTRVCSRSDLRRIWRSMTMRSRKCSSLDVNAAGLCLGMTWPQALCRCVRSEGAVCYRTSTRLTLTAGRDGSFICLCLQCSITEHPKPVLRSECASCATSRWYVQAAADCDSLPILAALAVIQRHRWWWS